MKHRSILILVLIYFATTNAQVADSALMSEISSTTNDRSPNFINAKLEPNVNLLTNEGLNNIQKNLYKIGDFAFGGIVFYVDESGEHGLVCAKEDQSNGVRWGKRQKVSENERLSKEMSTTTTIFNVKSDKSSNNTNDFASRLCKNLKVKEGGITYKDWYLPSKEELNRIYLNINIIDSTALANKGEMFKKTYYWSATAYDDARAWVQYFDSGKQAQQFKYYNNAVRAIRTF